MFKESFGYRSKRLIAVPYNINLVFKLWGKRSEYNAVPEEKKAAVKDAMLTCIKLGRM